MDTWIEISQPNLEHNAHLVHNLSGKPIAAVIKSNAYGHGKLQVAGILQRLPFIEAFCTFGLKESLELKEQTHTPKRIIALGYGDFELIKDALEHSIECVVHDMHSLNVIINCCKQYNLTARIHVKFDTGLGRLGFFPHELEQVMNIIVQHPYLIIAGCVTHMSHTLDEDLGLSSKQLVLFGELKNRMTQLCAHHHIACPAFCPIASGSVHHAQERSDSMIRTGTLLYGFTRTPHLKTILEQQQCFFKPVMQLKATIMSIKEVPAGTPIGYGATEYTSRPTRIALVPAGHRENYPAALSTHKTYATVGIKRAPLIGSISMNISAFDVTDIPEAQIGSTITLFGSENHDFTIAQATSFLHCKPIELTTAMPESIKRIVCP